MFESRTSIGGEIVSWLIISLLALLVSMSVVICVLGYRSWNRVQRWNLAIMECEKAYRSESPAGNYLLINDNPCRFSRSGTLLSLRARALQPDYERDKILMVSSGGPVRTEWLSESELVVTCLNCQMDSTSFVRSEHHGVHIAYKFSEAPEFTRSPYPD